MKRLTLRSPWRWVLVGLVMYGGIRLVSGTGELTSSGTTGSALRLAIPILLAGIGGLWSERAGVVNIGLEGMMVLGSWFGAWGTIHHGTVAGIVLAMLGGAAGAAIHAAAAVGFRVDQIISGVAVNLLAAGAVRVLSSRAFEGQAGGGLTQSPRVPGGVGHFTAPASPAEGSSAGTPPTCWAGWNAAGSSPSPTAPACSEG